jgi:hypothetical protein
MLDHFVPPGPLTLNFFLRLFATFFVSFFILNNTPFALSKKFDLNIAIDVDAAVGYFVWFNLYSFHIFCPSIIIISYKLSISFVK